MSEYVMRVTIAVPEGIVEEANDLAMVLGQGPNDAYTFRDPTWEDVEGNIYSLASTPIKPSFYTEALSALSRPEWDESPYRVNMSAANRAQDKLVIYNPLSPVTVTTSSILAVIDDDPRSSAIVMGLTRIEQ